MSDGRPKGFPSTRLESSRPTTWPSPIRDWQDDNFERQEQYSGGIGISIAGDKDRKYPAGWATKTRPPEKELLETTAAEWQRAIAAIKLITRTQRQNWHKHRRKKMTRIGVAWAV